MGRKPGMQPPNSPEKKQKTKNKKQKIKLPAQLRKPDGKTKQSLIDGANGRHKQPGNIKEEVVTIMALIGCYHMTARPISSSSPIAEAGYT